MNRLYLDNCCFNRPYDDQESKVIRLESEAKMMIQEKIKLGISIPDSIHVACAIVSGSDFFITTDRKIIKKRNKINDIKILNPIEYIINIEGND